MRIIFLISFIIMVFYSCNLYPVNSDIQVNSDLQVNNDIQEEPEVPEEPEAEERKWTFIVYMAADNDLESAAIADLNELEAVTFGTAPVTILVLLDRSSSYDTTNGNWTGTRLLEVKSDPNGLTGTIVSSRLNCIELGLSTNSETDLNTADPFVLSRLIDFAKLAYPAENYSLFVWGHGTGWRGGFDGESEAMPLKAVAFDDTAGQYMSLPAFGRAIAGKGLSLIGFDTCFAALLEVAYQIKNDAEILVGSEGAIPSTGWDYTALFTEFLKKPNLSVDDLGASIQSQFINQYKRLSSATISQIKLSNVNDLFCSFNDFSGAVANAITGVPSRNLVLNQILNNVERYNFTSFPSDLYIDINDFRKKMTAIKADITPDLSRQNAISAASAVLETSLANAVPSSWAANGTDKKIGVHVIPLQAFAVPAAMHELAYIRGSMVLEKSSFVENSISWAPNYIPQSSSFLDKLFYWPF